MKCDVLELRVCDIALYKLALLLLLLLHILTNNQTQPKIRLTTGIGAVTDTSRLAVSTVRARAVTTKIQFCWETKRHVQ